MSKEDKRLSMILITVDSLRANTTGYPGKVNQSTPSLDQFIQQGVMFAQAIAQGPYTTASIPSLLVGLYPIRLKPIPSNEIAGVLMEGVPTLAELLKQVGYHTGAFHSNPLLPRLFGYDRGFDTFYDDLFLKDLKLPQRAKLILNRAQRALRIHLYLPAAGINKKALDWLKKAKEPFFLWLHYMDPHGPYQSRRGFQYLNKIRAERPWRKAVKQLGTRAKLAYVGDPPRTTVGMRLRCGAGALVLHWAITQVIRAICLLALISLR